MNGDYLVIDRIATAGSPGVPEGPAGDLIRGQACVVRYIELLPGHFMPSHHCRQERVIYTVHGRWTLSAGGTHIGLGPGSLLWLKPDLPCRFEMPFDEPALLLVFQPVRNDEAKGDYRAGRELSGNMRVTTCEKGAMIDLGLLPPDHPARVFE